MEKTIRNYIKKQIKLLHEGRRVVKIYQSWKKGERANLNDLGEGNYGFDPRAIAQYFKPLNSRVGIAKEDVSVFGMSNGSVELHASSDKDKFHEQEDEPSDDEYDQMAKDAEKDDLMRRAAELGYIDLEEIGMFHDPIGYEKSKPNPKDQIFKKKYMGNGVYDIFKNGKKVKTIKGEGEANEWINNAKRELDEAGPYKGGNLLPGAEDIDFDVKSINMVYTDFGRFYGFNMYSEPGLNGQKEKFSFRADVNDFLQSKGIETEIPEGYDIDVLDSIVAALEKQSIEAEHNDYMDVSEGDPGLEPVSPDDEIYGDDDKDNFPDFKKMTSELGYLNEITVSGGQEAARNYPPTEDPGDMFAQKEVEELLPSSFESRNQELKARIQAHANWAKQDRYNNTFVHFQANTVTDGNNIYRIGMSQHYNGNYTDFKNPKFTEIRVKELDDESDMERDLGYYIVDTTALMQDLRKLKTIERVS
jgi:hypothetical protein